MEYASMTESIRRSEERFRGIERKSATQWATRPGERLIVRCDGVKLSRRYLKDSLSNPAFDDALLRSVTTVNVLFRNMVRPGTSRFFQRALVISDEVSFVLGTGADAYDGRVLKIASMVGSSLSSAMTGFFEFPRHQMQLYEDPDARAQIINFDARPLIVRSNDEVRDYLRWRWCVGVRNHFTKSLRLRSELSDREIYDSDLRTDVGLAWAELSRRDLASAAQAQRIGHLSSINAKGWLEGRAFASEETRTVEVLMARPLDQFTRPHSAPARRR